MPRIEFLDSIEQARALESDWRELVARADGITPFQHPEWLLPWYEVWAPDRVRLIVVRDSSGRLIALVPGVLANDRLELAGGGVSDYRAPILDRSSLDSAIDAVEAALAGTGLDVCFTDVPFDSPWVTAAQRNRRWTIDRGSVCPVVAIPGDPEQFRRTLMPGLRRNLKRYADRLIREASARFFTVAAAADVPPALDAMMVLHSKRWESQGASGVFADADVRRFHHATAPAMWRSGVLHLHMILAADAIVAVQYVMVQRGRTYSYIGGFDPEIGRYNPGTLLMAYAIDRAIAERCAEFDFLRGCESYKYRWGATDRCSVNLWRQRGR
jgi:CelD/BcsL family acetyltransferase involved in cellulose biosynthesis